MSEYQNVWKQRSRNHDNLVHNVIQRSIREQNRVISQNPDPSCGICEGFNGNSRNEFRRFWEWYKRMTREISERIENESENLGAHSYSGITRRVVLYLLSLGRSITEYGCKEINEGERRK
jgi:hypothetical protein